MKDTQCMNLILNFNILHFPSTLQPRPVRFKFMHLKYIYILFKFDTAYGKTKIDCWMEQQFGFECRKIVFFFCLGESF